MNAKQAKATRRQIRIETGSKVERLGHERLILDLQKELAVLRGKWVFEDTFFGRLRWLLRGRA